VQRQLFLCGKQQRPWDCVSRKAREREDGVQVPRPSDIPALLTYRHTRPVFLCILSAVAAAAAIFLFKDLQFGQQSPTIQTKFRRLAHIIIYFLWGFFKNFLVAKKKRVWSHLMILWKTGKDTSRVSRQGSSARESHSPSASSFLFFV
jgi:hypothetical protein